MGFACAHALRRGMVIPRSTGILRTRGEGICGRPPCLASLDSCCGTRPVGRMLHRRAPGTEGTSDQFQRRNLPAYCCISHSLGASYLGGHRGARKERLVAPGRVGWRGREPSSSPARLHPLRWRIRPTGPAAGPAYTLARENPGQDHPPHTRHPTPYHVDAHP